MAVEAVQQAPDVTLADYDRKPKALSEFRGKNVVLAFMPGAFTGVCTKESCTFRDSAAQFNDLNAQVVGVTIDAPASQKAWADSLQLNFPFLSDYARKAVNAYGVDLPNWNGMEGFTSARRSVFVIDKDGVVRWSWVAPVNTEEPNYDEINKVLAGLK